MADSQRKTANLFDESDFGLVEVAAGTYRVGTDVGVLPSGKYTLNAVKSSSAIQIYRTTKNGSTYNYEAISELPYTFTADGVSSQIFRSAGNTGSSWVDFGYSDVMLNTGETAQTYEPYGWQHSLRKLTTATETIQSGDTIYADGTAATIGLKGNTVQSGTPSPSNPVDVNGTGERTWNLAYKIIENANISTDGLIATASGYNIMVAKVAQGQVYSGTGYVYAFFNDEPDIGSTSYNESRVVNIFKNVTAPISGYVAVRYGSSENPMINEGSTAKPYEPYGYKIPILNGQQTTTIYLGSTQITRKITKYTFTGNETTFSCVATTDGQNYCVVYRFIDFGMTDIKDFDKIMQDIDYPIFISTHFEEKPNTNSDFNNIQPNQVGGNTVSAAGNRYIIFCVSGLTTAAEYSAWFAQQYANGTPVEVYYILETATTAAVNEPLMKIGTYADSISGVSIPTTDGANTITVDTTVQPSEFTATWTGWHDASVKEWGGSDWS